MATTRYFSKDNLRIIDAHDDGRNFFYFQDRRLEGYAIRAAAGGSSILANSAQNTTDYATGNTEADKKIVAEGGTIIDGGKMGATRRQRWNRMMILEHFAWPAVLDIESNWVAENNNIKTAQVKGALVAWGFSFAESQTAAAAYIPGGTKPTQASLSDMTDLPINLKDLMDVSELNSTGDFGAEIETLRTGRRSKDINKAFSTMNSLRLDGWTRLELLIDKDGFMRVILGSGTPEIPNTSWEWISFHGDENKVTRDILTVADKMYQASKAAADAV